MCVNRGARELWIRGLLAGSVQAQPPGWETLVPGA